ncbi:alpha/beta fold hydrolase [Glycomyces tarimensis]
MASVNDPATFVLVHGGGRSSWDWHLVAPRLRELGHEVIAVDLPIEDDADGVSEYADAVVAACEGRPNPAVVAHSFGGLVAPVVCSRAKTELLVLLAGMIPRPGETPGEWWTASGHDALDLSMEAEAQDGDLFMNGVPTELATEAFAKARDQSGAKWDEPSPLERWPDVPTRYLACRDDRFFPLEFARAHAAERLGITPDEIDGGHMVALSRPRELAERLHRYWSELGG